MAVGGGGLCGFLLLRSRVVRSLYYLSELRSAFWALQSVFVAIPFVVALVAEDDLALLWPVHVFCLCDGLLRLGLGRLEVVIEQAEDRSEQAEYLILQSDRRNCGFVEARVDIARLIHSQSAKSATVGMQQFVQRCCLPRLPETTLQSARQVQAQRQAQQLLCLCVAFDC